MVEHNTDVIIIGMGPGGESVGGQLGEAGLNVIGIETNLVGGECPYYGCIPSKMMIRAANALAEVGHVEGLAGTASATPDWTPVAQRIKEQATADWDDTIAVDRFVGKGGTFVRGRGVITGPKTVQVGDDTYVASKGIVIATGTQALVPPIPGLADTPYWTNKEIVQVKELPESMVVLGGGVIGLELGQALSRFGVKVSVVEGQDRLMPNFEPEVGDTLQETLSNGGIDIHVGQFAESVAYDETTGFTVTLADGTEVAAEKLLVAVGRKTFLKELGIGNLGLDEDARFMSIDENAQVQDGLWAVGDIAGEGLYTHLALKQADVAVAHILGNDVVPVNYDAMAAAVFTDPEIGAVGKTEAQAKDAGINVKTAFKLVAHTARGWMHMHGNDGFIKLVVDADRDVLIGATSAGPHGGEVLGLLALAVHAEVPIVTLRSMTYAYPTFYKGVEDTLNEL